MTREEAIECLKTIQRWTPDWDDREDGLSYWDAIDMALSALRPVSREKVERWFGGQWEGSADGYADGELVYDMWTCSECGYVIDEEDDPNMLPDFCPKCGAANTEKAMEILKKRLEALKDG